MKKKNKKSSFKNKNDLIFYILMAAFPIAQVILFYFIVNGNSILLAFKTYDGATGAFSYSNKAFKDAFLFFTTDLAMIKRIGNSFIMYILSLLIILPLSILFSFYIYKQKKASKFFRIILFLPSVISPVIVIMLFSYFVDRALPEIMYTIFKININGLLSDYGTQFKTILFYNVFIGFSIQILMFANSMSGINESLVEAAELEGASSLQELWHITLPSIWGTLTTFIVIGVAGIFTNQLNLVGFFGNNANVGIQSIGYYLFNEIYIATNAPGGIQMFPMLSAMGLILTVIAVPSTLIVKYLLEKYGPKEI